MSNKMFHRVLSLLLVLMMVLPTISMTIWAEEISEIATGVNTVAIDGVTISADEKGFLSMADGIVTITVKGGSYTSKSTIITVKNTTGTTTVISFDYEASDFVEGSWSLSPAGKYEKLLNVDEVLTFELKASAGKTATVVLSNIKAIKPAEDATVTVVYDPSKGTVSANNDAGQNGQIVVEHVGQTGVSLVAEPKGDYTFAGWVDKATGKQLYALQEYTYIPTDDITIEATFTRNAQFKVSGQTKTMTLDAAITAAQSGSTITLVTSGILEAGTYTIPKGVKLLIPYGSSDTGDFDEYPNTSSEALGSSQTPHMTLTLSSGTVIDCQGQICVNSRMYNQAGAGTGLPTGPYGHIQMESGSKIILTDADGDADNSGKLYCYGYITGDGEVIANSGTKVFEVFQMLGWMGGHSAQGWGESAGVIGNKEPSIESFYFNDYAVQNIEADLTVNYGAQANAVATVIASGKTKQVTVDYVGSNIGLVQLTHEGAVFHRSFDAATNNMTYILDGNVTVGGVKITIELSSFESIFAGGADSLSLNSAEHIFAIPTYMDFVAEEGSIVTLKNDYKLLPGASITIKKDAHVYVNGDLYLYDTADYVGQGYRSGNSIPVKYIATTQKSSGIPCMNENTPSAQIIFEGGILEVAATGGLYVTDNGGKSADKALKGIGTFINRSQNNSSVLDELKFSGTNNANVTPIAIQTTPAVGRIAGLTQHAMKYDSFGIGTYYGLGAEHDNYWYQVKTDVVPVSCKEPAHIAYNSYDEKGELYDSWYKVYTGESLPHTRGAEVGIVPPTCSEQGYTIYHCTACDSDYHDNFTASTGKNGWHTYKEGYCSECGCTLSRLWFEDMDRMAGAFKALTGHFDSSISNNWVADIDLDGVKQLYIRIFKTGGYWGSIFVDDEGFYISGVCSPNSDPTPEQWHTVEIPDNADIFRYCYYYLGPAEYLELSLAEHTHTYTVVITPPTKTTQGYTSHSCAECGDRYVDNVVNAVQDDWHIHKDGRCSDCNCELMRIKLESLVLNSGAVNAATGAVESNADYVYVDIAIPNGAKEVYFWTYPTQGTMGSAFMKDGEYISGIYDQAAAYWITVEIPEGATTLRYGFRKDTAPAYVEFASGHIHDYQEVITLPNCVRKGYTTYTCVTDGCGDTYVTDYVNSIGQNGWHVYDNGKCSICGWTVTRVNISDYNKNTGSVSSVDGSVASSHTDNQNVEITIPSGAGHLYYKTFGTGTYWGLAFMNGKTYVSGHATPNVSNWQVVEIPAAAKTVKYTFSKNYVPDYMYFSIEGHTHSYVVSMTKEVTCTEAGEKTYTCACGDVYTETIPARGHTAKTVSNVVASTCTEQGYTTYICECGESFNVALEKAWHTNVNGTCSVCNKKIVRVTLEDLERYTGSISSATGYVEATHTDSRHVYITIPADTEQVYCQIHGTNSYWGHAFINGDTYISGICSASSNENNWWKVTDVPANATTLLYMFNKDAVREYVEFALAHTHNYKANGTTPTCTEAGSITYTCECGDSYTVVTEKIWHTYDNGKCAVCGIPMVRVLLEDFERYTGSISSTDGHVEAGHSNSRHVYITIPVGAEEVYYQIHGTQSYWGQAFMNGDTYITGMSGGTGNAWAIANVPSNATTMRYMFNHDAVREYVEFAGRDLPGYMERPETGRHPFSVEVNIAPAQGNPDGYVIATDYGYIQLPTSYTTYGEPTRLIIFCHGAGANLSAFQNNTAGTTHTFWWNEMGYAVMDMYACPPGLTGDNSELHYGNPVVVDCYKAGYEYVMENFNLKTDGIFLIGASMGGLSSFQIAQSGEFPVLAQVGYCPVIDTFKQAYVNPWSSASYQRSRIAQYFGFEGIAPTFTGSKYPSAAEIQYYKDNFGKTIQYSPIYANVLSGDLYKIFDVIPSSATALNAEEEALYSQLTAYHPNPIMIFHNTDDSTVAYRYSKYFVDMVNRSGQTAILHTFTSGGHNAWQNGDNYTLQGINGEITVKTSQYEAYLFFRQYEEHVEDPEHTEHTIWIDPAVAPTCEQTGLTQGSHCAGCGEVIVEQTVVDKVWHNNVNGRCSYCNCKLVRVQLENHEQYIGSISSATGYVEATHTDSRHVIISIPQGAVQVYYQIHGTQSNWGQAFMNGDVYITGVAGGTNNVWAIANVPSDATTMLYMFNHDAVREYVEFALDHECVYESVVVAPTCEQKGYTTHTCSCGDSYVDNYTDKVWHSYQDGYCAVCGIAMVRVMIEDFERFEGSISSTDGHVEAGHYNSRHVYITIPVGAEEVYYQIHGTLSYWGQAFMNGDTYITGMSGGTGNAWAIANVPSNATTMRYMFNHDAVREYVEFIVPNHEHTYETTVVAPTCSSKGYTIHNCSTCGGSFKDNYKDKLWHTYQNGYCATCGCAMKKVVFTEDMKLVGTHHVNTGAYLAATDNWYTTLQIPTGATQVYFLCYGGGSGNYGSVFVDASGNYVSGYGTSGASHWYRMDIPANAATFLYCHTVKNSATYLEFVIPEHTHSYETTVVEATCTAGGYTTHTCSTCGDTFVDNVVGKKWHTAENGKCSMCGLDIVRIYLWDLDKQQGSVQSQNGTVASDHSANYYVVIPIPVGAQQVYYQTFPTGATWGLAFMDAEGNYISGHYKTSPREWVILEIPENAATVWYMFDKNNTTEYVEFAVDHTHNYTATVIAPTCSAGGYTTYTCECGHSYTGDETAVDPNAHKWNEGVVTPPTCTEEGYTTYTCACGASYIDNEVGALNHNFKNYVSDNNATFDADGTKTATCDRENCNEKHTVTDEGTKLIAVAQVGVTKYQTLAEAIAAAQSGETVKLLADCEFGVNEPVVLGNAVLDFNGKTLKGNVVGKLMLNGGTLITPEKDYVMAGPEADYYITTDAVLIIDQNGNIVVDSGIMMLAQSWWTGEGQTLTIAKDAMFIIPADMTLNVLSTVVIEGTVTVNGTVNLYTANATIQAPEGLNVTTTAGDFILYVDGMYTVHIHSYDAVVTPPKCLVDGYTTYTCSVCNDTYKGDVVAATGHTGTPEQSAGTNDDRHELVYNCCGEIAYEGEHEWEDGACAICKRECSHTFKDDCVAACDKNCGHERTPSHVYDPNNTVPENVVPSTCTQSGRYEAVCYCTACGAEIFRQVKETPVLDHDMQETEKAVEPTCTKPGKTAVYTCANDCGKTEGGEEIPATGEHNYVDGKCDDCGEADPNVKPEELFTPTFGNGSANTDVNRDTADDGTMTITFKAGTNTKAPDITITSPVGGWKLGEEITFTVSSGEDDVACVVIVKDADGNYKRLFAITTDGVHSFTGILTDKCEIIVAVKGDANGDGLLDINDRNAMSRALYADKTSPIYQALSPLAFIVCDTNHDENLNINDKNDLARALYVDHASPIYKALEWDNN